MLDVKLLRFPHKKIRANVIKNFIAKKRYRGVVCFSCGNASRELKNVGLNVLDISPKGDLIPNRWFQPSEIAEKFPEYFDATSGHLPMELMIEIAVEYKKYLGLSLPSCYIPTGSGETIFCLKLAYPKEELIAVYNLDDATEYNENAVLNDTVKIFAKQIIFANTDQKFKNIEAFQEQKVNV